MSRLRVALVAACLAALVVAAGAQAQTMQRVEDGGVAIEFAFDGAGPEDVLPRGGTARLRLSDAASGRPITGARPAAWIVRRRSLADVELACVDRAKQLSQGSLGVRADVDLNAYRLVTLNRDRTVAFINPFVSLNRSKLESIVELPGTGVDWVLDADAGRIFVALRDTGEIAVVDVATRTLTDRVALGAETLPTRLVLDAARGRLWVGLDGTTEVAAIDTAALRVVTRVEAGAGVKTLAVAAEERFLAVTSAGAGRVTLVDRGAAKKLADVAVPGTPVGIVWSEAAAGFVTLAANGEHLVVVDPVARSVRARTAIGRGAVHLRLLDGGRLAFALHPLTSQLSIVDLAQGRVVAVLPVAAGADQVVFTRNFAYVHGARTADITLVDLGAVRAAMAGNGTPRVLAVPFGRGVPGDAHGGIDFADVVVPAPEGNGVYAANPADGMIYRYSEGLMVPAGSLSNYKRAALGLMVLDGSLRAAGPGAFAAHARFDQPGRYDVVVRTGQPATTACFTLAVGGAAPAAATDPRARAQLLGTERAGDRTLVRVALVDGDGRPAITDDAVLLAVQQPGAVWQRRVPLRADGAGGYVAALQVPGGTAIDLLVSAPSIELAWTRGRLGRLGPDGREAR